MKHKIFGILSLLLIIFAGALALKSFLYPSSDPKPASGGSLLSDEEKARFTLPASEQIVVTSPEANAEVSSPLKISAEVEDFWLEAGQMPIAILADDGSILARGYVRANGEKKTNGRSIVESEVSFSKTSSRSGLLIFENSNSRNLAETGRSYSVPVRFSE